MPGEVEERQPVAAQELEPDVAFVEHERDAFAHAYGDGAALLPIAASDCREAASPRFRVKSDQALRGVPLPEAGAPLDAVELLLAIPFVVGGRVDAVSRLLCASLILEALYAWSPCSYFGMYWPDTFWLEP